MLAMNENINASVVNCRGLIIVIINLGDEDLKKTDGTHAHWSTQGSHTFSFCSWIRLDWKRLTIWDGVRAAIYVFVVDEQLNNLSYSICQPYYPSILLLHYNLNKKWRRWDNKTKNFFFFFKTKCIELKLLLTHQKFYFAFWTFYN